MGGGIGERRNNGGGGGRLSPSDGLANHSCGLNHSIVDAIDCFDIVAILRVTHRVGLHLVDVDDATNTHHHSICNVLLVLPASRQVVGSTHRTRMHQKDKVVGCGGRDSHTTTCHSPHSNAWDTKWMEERSIHSSGHAGGVGAINLGDSWASGQVGGIVCPVSTNGR
jgi:hypothetical protein